MLQPTITTGSCSFLNFNKIATVANAIANVGKSVNVRFLNQHSTCNSSYSSYYTIYKCFYSWMLSIFFEVRAGSP